MKSSLEVGKSYSNIQSYPDQLVIIHHARSEDVDYRNSSNHLTLLKYVLTYFSRATKVTGDRSQGSGRRHRRGALT